MKTLFAPLNIEYPALSGTLKSFMIWKLSNLSMKNSQIKSSRAQPESSESLRI
jgi:hypothetical protein